MIQNKTNRNSKNKDQMIMDEIKKKINQKQSI